MSEDSRSRWPMPSMWRWSRRRCPSPKPACLDGCVCPPKKISAHVVDRVDPARGPHAGLKDRAIQLRQLARYQARRERYLSAVVAQELKELQALSTPRVTTIQEGLDHLNASIDEWDDARIGDIARHLCRRAQRAEALAVPLAGRYSNLVLSRILSPALVMREAVRRLGGRHRSRWSQARSRRAMPSMVISVG